ncbi:DUF998 domain-containing protein [Allorhizocola rhizosphaerae]|uniref:DUF998 domain-containing protein n=1 Tax=Allorhizocola rhizosphaerae TaxID=1872709 RepID=UPI000E3D568A|nr:DUF998 domain-containing protein [Allorhizocola rhizosphaerae]
MPHLFIALSGVLAIAALHVLPPTNAVSPIRRTISEYALYDTGWLFNLGVLAVAVGSLGVLVGLVRSGIARAGSVAGAGLLLWCVGLTGVVAFPKHNWAVGPSVNGDIHRVASLIAFVALPVGAIAVAWAWRRSPVWRNYALWTIGFAVLALLCFGLIAGAFALQPVTGVRWWRAIPLGAVERALATAEVATVLTLAWWSSRARLSHRSETLVA